MAKGMAFTEEAETSDRGEEPGPCPAPVALPVRSQSSPAVNDNQDTGQWILKAMPRRKPECQETRPILLGSRGSKRAPDHLARQWQSQDETPGHRGPESTHLAIVLCSPQLPEPPIQASGAGSGKALSPAAPGTAGSSALLGPETLEWASRKSPGPGTQL